MTSEQKKACEALIRAERDLLKAFGYMPIVRPGLGLLWDNGESGRLHQNRAASDLRLEIRHKDPDLRKLGF